MRSVPSRIGLTTTILVSYLWQEAPSLHQSTQMPENEENSEVEDGEEQQQRERASRRRCCRAVCVAEVAVRVLQSTG